MAKNTRQKASDLTAPLSAIERDFDEFERGLNRCLAAVDFDSADLKGVYERLYRLRERYKDEREKLTPRQRTALDKNLMDDHFIAGLLGGLRTVATHVKSRTRTFHIRTPQGQKWTFDQESSAQAVFSMATPTLLDTDGAPRRIEHLKWLSEAAHRVNRSLARARSS